MYRKFKLRYKKEVSKLGMKKFLKSFSVLLSVFLCGLFLLGVCVSANLPQKYFVTKSSGLQINNNIIPITARTTTGMELVQAGVLNSTNKSYDADIMLMNIIPIKSVTVQVVDETRVYPCGTPFGIKIFTEGVVLVGITEVKTDNQVVNPGKDARLKTGDVIISINGQAVNSNEQVAQFIQNSGGQPLSFAIRRENMSFNTELTPIKSATDDTYKAGLWVRDSSAGIGTLTFYDEKTNMFAGLGHGICDVDTGELMPLLNGDIVNATINGIVKGVKGSPGELRGYFSGNQAIGTLSANVNTGVYGFMQQEAPAHQDSLVVAMKQQVTTGSAQILTTIDGSTPCYYDIEIESVNYKEDMPTKNMVIRITDPALLEATGGIVQGMSGSPIVQNGMLVGAVTHVFVNEPQRGYGIFAENMLSVCNSISNSEIKKAS